MRSALCFVFCLIFSGCYSESQLKIENKNSISHLLSEDDCPLTVQDIPLWVKNCSDYIAAIPNCEFECPDYTYEPGCEPEIITEYVEVESTCPEIPSCEPEVVIETVTEYVEVEAECPDLTCPQCPDLTCPEIPDCELDCDSCPVNEVEVIVEIPGECEPEVVACEFYDGLTEDCPSIDCYQILTDGYSIGDGIYWIDPNSNGNAYEVFCLMDSSYDGGGWTQILTSSDDGVDTLTWNNKEYLTYNHFTYGNINERNKDFKSLALHDVKMEDVLFIHKPSDVWAGYSNIDSGIKDFGSFVGTVGGPHCYEYGEGFPLSSGNLEVVDQLISTELFFNVQDKEGSVCGTGNGTHGYGPAWSVHQNSDLQNNYDGFDDPGAVSGLGPMVTSPDTENDPGPILSISNQTRGYGYGWAILGNTGEPDEAENYIQVFVRDKRSIEIEDDTPTNTIDYSVCENFPFVNEDEYLFDFTNGPEEEPSFCEIAGYCNSFVSCEVKKCQHPASNFGENFQNNAAHMSCDAVSNEDDFYDPLGGLVLSNENYLHCSPLPYGNAERVAVPITISTTIYRQSESEATIFHTDVEDFSSSEYSMSRGAMLRISNDYGIKFTFNRRSKVVPADMPINKWYNITIVVQDNNHFDIYLNGVKLSGSYFGEENESSERYLSGSGYPFWIGASAYYNDYGIGFNQPAHFTGKIKDLRIYKRVLSEDEVVVLNECN